MNVTNQLTVLQYVHSGSAHDALSSLLSGYGGIVH